MSSIVRDAARLFGINVRSARLVRDVLDTTYRVTADTGNIAALRIRRSADAETSLRSEVTWVAHLAEHGLPVPHPLTTLSGDLVAPIGDGRWCSMLTWLPGRRTLKHATRAQARAMGVLLAALHRAARSFTPPAEFTLKTWSPDKMVGYYDQTRPRTIWCLSEEENATVRAWEKRIAALYPQLETGMITGDYGLHNTLWHAGAPSFVDFNDTGYGPFAYDLALAADSLDSRSLGLSEALVDRYGSPPIGYGEEVRAAVTIRMMRWRAGRPGGDEGARIVRELLPRLHDAD